MIRYIIGLMVIFSMGCATYHVTTDCLNEISSDKERLKTEHNRKQLNSSEYIHAMNDEITLITVMELSNKVFKAAQHNYCDADYNQARWEIQEEINFAEAMRK